MLSGGAPDKVNPARPDEVSAWRHFCESPDPQGAREPDTAIAAGRDEVTL
jgi:hypothetical protein